MRKRKSIICLSHLQKHPKYRVRANKGPKTTALGCKSFQVLSLNSRIQKFVSSS